MKTWQIIDKRVSDACKIAKHTKIRVNYSAYELDENNEPTDNLDDIAVKGRVVLAGFRDEFWGGVKSKDYYSQVLESPTWLQVCVYANEMIRMTRDRHHSFLEGLSKTKFIHDGVPVYEFLMGS